MKTYSYFTERKLRDIMYSAMGYSNNNGLWHKEKRGKKQHITGQIQCSVCKEYFDRDFIIRKKKKCYCSECEKTVM
jgi:hypothetical protein